MKSAKRSQAAASVTDHADDGSASMLSRFRSARPAAELKNNMIVNAVATTLVLLAGNASATKCVDDASYVSSMGLPCSAYTQLECDGFRHVGWTDQQTDELVEKCPSSCRSSFCDEVNTSTSIRQDRSLLHGHVSDVEQKWRHSKNGIDKKNLGGNAGGDGINAHLIPQSYCPPSWGESCKDDPFFHTHVGFHCEAHANLDCTMFGSIGFTEQQVYDIINSCPCSCRVECGTWTMSPTHAPTQSPTISKKPTHSPTSTPSARPTVTASASPSSSPTSSPTASPTGAPTSRPTNAPSDRPSQEPSTVPSPPPSHFPTTRPTSRPTIAPSDRPSQEPSVTASSEPSVTASAKPSVTGSNSPSSPPTGGPTLEPTPVHSTVPSPSPSAHPTPTESSEPSAAPSAMPTSAPTENPTPSPTASHSSVPTVTMSEEPSQMHSSQPSALPTSSPSRQASSSPSAVHSSVPSSSPSPAPSTAPSSRPSSLPTQSLEPSSIPTLSTSPSSLPSYLPTNTPTISPSAKPSVTHSASPSSLPSQEPTASPTNSPSKSPSSSPSASPTPASVEMATVFTIPLELNNDITGTDAQAMQDIMKRFLQLNQRFGADNVDTNVTIEVSDVHVDEIIPRSSSSATATGDEVPVVRKRRMKKSSSSSSKSKQGDERDVNEEDMDIGAEDIGNRIESSPTVSIITSEVAARVRISCNVYPHRPLEVDPAFQFVPRLLGGFAAGDFESYLYQLASSSSTFASPASEEEQVLGGSTSTNRADDVEVDEIGSDSIDGDENLEKKNKGKGKKRQEITANDVSDQLSAHTGGIAAATQQVSSNTSDDPVHWWNYVMNNKALFIGAIVGISMLVMLVISAAIIGIRRRRHNKDVDDFEGSEERPTIFYDEEGRQVIMAPRGPDRYVMSAPTPTNAMWKKQASSTRSKKRYAFSPKGVVDDDSPSGRDNNALSQQEKQWQDLLCEQMNEQQRRDNLEEQQIAGAFPSNKANCDSSVVGLVVHAQDDEEPNNNGTSSTPKEKSRGKYNSRSIPVFGTGMFGGQKPPPTTPKRSYVHLNSGVGSPMSNAPEPPSHPRNALAMQRKQQQQN